jgi:hypothetical protein
MPVHLERLIAARLPPSPPWVSSYRYNTLLKMVRESLVP